MFPCATVARIGHQDIAGAVRMPEGYRRLARDTENVQLRAYAPYVAFKYAVMSADSNISVFVFGSTR